MWVSNFENETNVCEQKTNLRECLKLKKLDSKHDAQIVMLLSLGDRAY